MSSSDVIHSRSNAVVKRFRSVGRKGDPDVILLEGIKLVREALSAGLPLIEALALPKVAEREALVTDLIRRGVPVRLTGETALAAASPATTSGGLVALGRRPRFREDDVFAGTPLVVVAFGLQNPGNLGALLRTAEAAGASGVILTEGCADPLSWKALRGSMGSAFRLPHLGQVPADRAISLLRDRGLSLVAASGHAPTPFTEVDYTRPVAILLGAEGAGLPPDALASASFVVRIPMADPVESLNAAVAAGLLLFEAARQRGWPK